MTPDRDIYRAANELIEQHGEAADIEAAMRADECLAAGDMEGEAVWLRIVKAIRGSAARGKQQGGNAAMEFFWTSHPLFVYVLGICRGVYPGG